ncbi:MAG: hypothetical protein JJU02_16490 [Cryomorphaceae bacterium]|nr:hypothetical protein [Cryomorphaceae bacterium]
MEEKDKQLKSIFGQRWEPVRKWFYPTWLLYELSIRFYEYAMQVQIYFIEHLENFTSFVGEIGIQTAAIFSGVATFIICTVYLTTPTCFVFYKFFKTQNLTSNQFEIKIKKYF